MTRATAMQRPLDWGLPATLCAATLFAAPAFWVLPSIDDWTTARPYVEGLPTGALRPSLFFRPLEQLLRLAVGSAPAASTALLHLTTVSGHLLSVGLLYQLLRPRGTGLAVVASCLFATTASIAAAVWSVDSAIQTWSTALGLLGVWLYSKNPHGSSWLVAALLALLCKESAATWLLLPPLVGLYSNALARAGVVLTDASGKQPGRPPSNASATRTRSHLGCSVALFAGYLACRLFLTEQGGPSVGTDRYDFNLNPLIWLRNILQLGTVALTAPDTVALFGDPGWRGWGVTSVVLSAPLALWAIWNSALTLGLRGSLLGAALIVLTIAPHLPLGHVSEMYAHPIVAMSCLVLSLPLPLGRRLPLQLSLCLFVFVSGVVSIHKGVEMIATGRAARDVGRELRRQWGDRAPPGRVCLVELPPRRDGYSVFQASPAKAADGGAAIAGQFDFASPRSFLRRPTVAECEASSSDATVWFEDQRTPRIRPTGDP